jgi:hypothetical protein
MDTTREISLPLRTSRTRGGPLVRLEPPALVVDYNCEEDDGALRWARIRFSGVMAFEYRQEACCLASDVEAYNKMLEVRTSARLDDIRRCYERSVPRESRVTEASEFAQFLIYFDDSGCVDVIASSFQLETVV